jgi:hypothetical protein
MGSFPPSFNRPRLQRLHANVMERCMRMPGISGKTVSIDSLLIAKRSNQVQLAAVYWAMPHEGLPEIHEAHFYIEGKDTLRVYEPDAPTDWDAYKWIVDPDGTMEKL